MPARSDRVASHSRWCRSPSVPATAGMRRRNFRFVGQPFYAKRMASAASFLHHLVRTSTPTVWLCKSAALNNRFDIRLLDAGWLRTQFPNGTDNIQNILRLGLGIVVRFGH